MEKTKGIIIGAAGRDFHNFNTAFRNRPNCRIVAFTATQIPSIEGRRYPPQLAGPLYPEGIPIHSMDELEELIRDHGVDFCVFSYSDIHYVDLMQVCNRVVSAGADFRLHSPAHGQIESKRPVISVVAVRTGCGKSQTSRRLASLLKNDLGVQRLVVVRHPMPYGDLAAQAVQRFASIADLAEQNCTIEEMEDYEPHIAAGNVVYAGVDYERILKRAEQEADVILWDGGNNDSSFYRSDLTVTVTDPLRAGHELLYWAGETNLSMADVVVINKCDSARPEDIETVKKNAESRNPKAVVLTADSRLVVGSPELLRGKRVVVIEDGPTLTHGEMDIGAGVVACRRNGAEIVDPRPFAVGSIAQAYKKYPRLGPVVPALGYYPRQLQELRETIARSDCDSVVIATPIDLRRVIQLDKPSTRVRYELDEHDPAALRDAVAGCLIGKATSSKLD